VEHKHEHGGRPATDKAANAPEQDNEEQLIEALEASLGEPGDPDEDLNPEPAGDIPMDDSAL
jgi:hypothetical protein